MRSIFLNRKNKYKSTKVVINGTHFDSQKEAKRYSELIMLERAKIIHDLEVHPKYNLIEGFTDKFGNKERVMKYIADFSYKDKHETLIVEDVKGFKTRDYVNKRKLFRYLYSTGNNEFFPPIKFIET